MKLHLSRSGARPLRSAPPDRGHFGSQVGPLAGLLAGGLALIFTFAPAHPALALGGPASPSPTVSPALAQHPREMTYIKRRWGVEIMFVRQTALGYMLEFRYKVLDPEKAKPLFERQTKPVLTHEETGARLVVPVPAKTGALRTSNLPLADHTYWMFFTDPGKIVQPGDQVSIEIGDFRVDGLTVQ
jgi:hypothetical protein